MSQVTARLVLNEQKQVCMQVTLGSYMAMLPLPEELAGKTNEELKPFFDEVVPEMIRGLKAMRRSDNKKLGRKAKCVTSSIKLSPNSEAKILSLPHPK